MKKAVIFYFSGTGNTWWVAKRIGQKLKDEYMKIRTCSIEQVSVEEANELISVSDVVGFGYPVYCSDIPELMKTFMQSLNIESVKKTFVFCTQESFSGDGTRVATEFLEKTQFDIKYTMHIKMPNNITSAISPLSYNYTPKEQNEILKKADERIGKFVYYILEDIPGTVGFTKVAKALGSVQRTPYRKLYKYAKHMITFTNKCTHCGYCEKLCPVDNIEITKNGNLTYNKCIQCMRCYNYCPNTAIRIFGVEHNPKRGQVYKGPVRKFNPENLKTKKVGMDNESM
ncbi:MAG: EFR1 family ferrodoxin [Cellulosilyticaceae bacterium]